MRRAGGEWLYTAFRSKGIFDESHRGFSSEGNRMSAGNDDGSSLISIALGTLIPAALSAGVGMFAALATWPPVVDSAFSTMFAGICVGAVMGFAVAWFMSWHASVVGVLADKPNTAMIWGVVPGLLFGLTLGPIFAAVMGWFFGQLLSAAVFGLFFGPIAGVLGWEIGFFVANFLGQRNHSAAH